MTPTERRAPIALSALAALATILAVWIAREVAERETTAFDTRVLEAIHAATTPGLLAAARFFTDLGPPFGITAVVAVAATVLWMNCRRAAAAVLVSAAVVTALVDAGLKELFERARPDLWPRPPISGDSFPSGHAVESTMVYGAIAVLLARSKPTWRPAIAVIATALVLAIAASRAVLGVHWPSDLAAGLAIGTLCLIATIAALDRFAPRT
jgi:membrane-associated phospholipid phosphatase